MRCVVAQARRVEHEVDLGAGPRERVVGADHDLAGTGLGDQVAQRLGREHDGVEEELAVLEIRGRLLLGQRADTVGEASDHRVRAVGVGRQEAAAMRGADLQPGKAVERALEDQVRQRDRGFERVADRVGQQAAAAQPAARLELARAQRVHEDQDAQLLALGPERMEPGIGQFLAGDAAAHADAAEAQLLDRMLDLLGGELGMLQRRRREGDEAVGVGRAELDQRLVLDLDQLGRDVALGAVPVGIDAERLDVDALRVHRRDAHAGVGPSAGPAPRADA